MSSRFRCALPTTCAVSGTPIAHTPTYFRLLATNPRGSIRVARNHPSVRSASRTLQSLASWPRPLLRRVLVTLPYCPRDIFSSSLSTTPTSRFEQHIIRSLGRVARQPTFWNVIHAFWGT